VDEMEMEMKRNGFRFPYSGYTIRGTIWIQSFCLGLNEVVGGKPEREKKLLYRACMHMGAYASLNG